MYPPIKEGQSLGQYIVDRYNENPSPFSPDLGTLSESIVRSVPFEDLPKYVNDKFAYVNWAIKKRLKGEEFSASAYELE